MSDCHVDASGLATFVRIILGRKLWLIATEDDVIKSEVFTNYVDMKWRAVVLGPQDEL